MRIVHVQHKHQVVGKILHFEQDLRKANSHTWGHLQQMNLLRIIEMSLTKVNNQQQQQVMGKFYEEKSYFECYLQPKIGPPSPYQEMVLNVSTLMCS